MGALDDTVESADNPLLEVVSLANKIARYVKH